VKLWMLLEMFCLVNLMYAVIILVNVSQNQVSTRDFSGGKGGRYVWPTTLPPSCADCLEILGASICWNPTGLSRPVAGQLFYDNMIQFPACIMFLRSLLPNVKC
jgi:hypothetical protein